MPRNRYFRKRPGYRSYVGALWLRLHPFMEAQTSAASLGSEAERDLASLEAGGLSPDQIKELRGLLAELGVVFREGLAGHDRPIAPLPEEVPEFFAIGAEAPAGRLRKESPLFQRHLKPKGRSRKAAQRRLRPFQAEVDEWMLASAHAQIEKYGRIIKQEEAEAVCRAAINASRQQARVAFNRLPSGLRRGRGAHDRWVTPSRIRTE